MKRLVIAIDCDDVLIPSQEFLVDTYNRLYGAHVRLGQEFDEWGADYDEVMRRCGEIAQSEGFKNLAPNSEGVEVLKRLAMHHELHVVTARKEEEREFTQAAIDHVLPNVFAAMEFVGWQGSKGEVCRRIKADVLIDDNARHLHNAIEQGLPRGGAILFGDYPWNEADSHHNDLKHCRDWPSVQLAIDLIAERTESNERSV